MTDAEITDNQFVAQLARQILQRGWRSPALFSLEAGRPLALLLGQLLWTAQPALSLFFSASDINQVAQLLERPAALDRLQQMLRQGDMA